MADFFGKMMDGINKGVATVSTGSKTLVEKSKVNSQIKTLEDEKRQLCELLGARVYHIFTNSEADIPRAEVASFCKEVTARVNEIEVQKQKIEELDREMNQVVGNTQISSSVCTCGYANATGAKFCAKCGKPLH